MKYFLRYVCGEKSTGMPPNVDDHCNSIFAKLIILFGFSRGTTRDVFMILSNISERAFLRKKRKEKLNDFHKKGPS